MNIQLQNPMKNRSVNRKRYRQILSVFARHGYGTVIKKLQQNRSNIRANHKEETNSLTELTPAEHLRLALEELGPTFIKIGQFLATRPDMLQPEFIQELAKLQDAAPPETWENIRAVLGDQLGDEPEKIFVQIEPVPLGAASLAQVHAAVLKNDENVVVKVQRPNIKTTIETDLEIIRDLAALAQRTDWGERNQPEMIAEMFALSLRNELDYCREGRNADRFRQNFSGDEKVHVPDIYWKYTTPRVLVMERLKGVKIDDIAALDALGFDRKQIAVDAASTIVKEVLRDGFYHADPHGGNYIVLENGVIGVLDFGMVAELNERDRRILTRLYIHVISLDADGIVNELLRMNTSGSSLNRNRLVSDLEMLLQKYHGLALKDMRMQEILTDVYTLASRYNLVLSANMTMLGKTLSMMEGLGLKLDPDFDIFSVSEPIVKQLKQEMLLPSAEWGEALLRQGVDWSEVGVLLPRASRRLLEKIEQGQPFDVQLLNAEKLISALGRLVNRLSLSMIIAALVIALSILITTVSKGSPLQTIISTGFTGVVILSIWLIISIIRGK